MTCKQATDEDFADVFIEAGVDAGFDKDQAPYFLMPYGALQKIVQCVLEAARRSDNGEADLVIVADAFVQDLFEVITKRRKLDINPPKNATWN